MQAVHHTDRKGKGLVMFKIGDLVVHPMHGAGVIDNIVQERVAGTIQEYYEFRMCMGGLLLKIPVANSQVIGVRSIISPAEAERPEATSRYCHRSGFRPQNPGV